MFLHTHSSVRSAPRLGSPASNAHVECGDQQPQFTVCAYGVQQLCGAQEQCFQEVFSGQCIPSCMQWYGSDNRLFVFPLIRMCVLSRVLLAHLSTCTADATERFHIFVSLLVIVLHNASDMTFEFSYKWIWEMLTVVVTIYGAEVRMCLIHRNDRLMSGRRLLWTGRNTCL